MLSERIRELRISRNLSQVELAKRLGISKQSLSNWENDNIMPSIDMLVRLATCLDVSTDYLLGREDRTYLEVSGLSPTELAHLQLLINDLRKTDETDPVP